MHLHCIGAQNNKSNAATTQHEQTNLTKGKIIIIIISILPNLNSRILNQQKDLSMLNNFLSTYCNTRVHFAGQMTPRFHLMARISNRPMEIPMISYAIYLNKNALRNSNLQNVPKGSQFPWQTIKIPCIYIRLQHRPLPNFPNHALRQMLLAWSQHYKIWISSLITAYVHYQYGQKIVACKDFRFRTLQLPHRAQAHASSSTCQDPVVIKT